MAGRSHVALTAKAFFLQSGLAKRPSARKQRLRQFLQHVEHRAGEPGSRRANTKNASLVHGPAR